MIHFSEFLSRDGDGVKGICLCTHISEFHFSEFSAAIFPSFDQRARCAVSRKKEQNGAFTFFVFGPSSDNSIIELGAEHGESFVSRLNAGKQELGRLLAQKVSLSTGTTNPLQLKSKR